MKEFNAAQLEVVTFEEDVVVASCLTVICPANSCQCNQHIVCEGDTAGA